MLLGQKFSQVLGTSGSKPAFRYLAKTTTFKDAYTYIQRESFFFQNEIGHKKNVGIFITNCPHFWYVFFGLANTMNVSIPFDPSLPDPVIADRIKFLKIEFLVISDDLVRRAQELVRVNQLQVKIIEVEKRRFGEYDTTHRLPPNLSPKETDPILYLPTSGHAGKVRFIPITHKMIEASAMALRSPYRLSGMDMVFTPHFSFANPFVFFHGGIIPLLAGSGLLIWDNPVLTELVPELIEGKMTRMVMKPSYVQEFFNGCREANFKLPMLRSITLIRGQLPETARTMAKEEFNCKILRVYGQTETCWAVAMTNFEEPEPPEFNGSVLPGVKAKVVDYNGDEIPPKNPQIGQLVLNCALNPPGYYEDKDATRLFIRGASFYTGDWVEITKDGKLRYIDRRDNIIRVGPTVITPESVEKVVSQMPEVERCTAIELKDGLGKTRCVAVIKRLPKTSIAAQDVTKFCEERMPKGTWPERVAFVEEFPEDESGINKYKLRRDLNGLI